MTKFKKSLAALMAVVSTASALCVPMGASAENKTDINSIYIKANEVPDDVVSYARDMFSHFTYNDMANLGFEESAFVDMKLGKPFTVTDVDGKTDTYEQYYFPVMSNDEVAATLIVNVNTIDNSMSYQFCQDNFSNALNDVTSDVTNPVEICVNDDCFFAVDESNEKQLLCTSNGVDVIDIDMNIVDKSVLLSDTADIVRVDDNNVYSDTTLKWITTRAYQGIKLPVQYVNNYSYTGTDGKLHGTCWASCLGSLASYYNNPSTGGPSGDASNIRYDALIKYGNVGNIDTAISGVSYYANVNLTKGNGRLTWDALKTKISHRAPSYSRWTTTADAAAHAMVLSGYRYDNTAPSNTSYYGIYVMDPNKSTNVLISYNGTYPISGNTYTWTATAYKN